MDTSAMAHLTFDETNPQADRKLLIAVDFGTTFSGVAWAQTRRVGYVDSECSPTLR